MADGRRGPSPDPEKLALALHIRRTEPDLSLRQIAERIGVRSPTTVSNYLAMAEQAEVWFPAVDRREVAGRLNLVYATVMDRLLRRLEEEEAEPEKVALAIKGIGQELAKLHGLYAPTRSVTELATEAPAPDPETTAAIQAALADLRAQDYADDEAPRSEK
jgi:transcriptional regulator with XRE-family HTH domain